MDRHRRPLAVGCVLAAALVAFVEPAAAQSLNRQLFERLNRQFLYVALPLTLFVEFILIYAVIRFYRNDDPQPTTKDPALEITWTVATAVILLFVGFSAYTVLGSPYMSPQAASAAGGDQPGAPNGSAVEIDAVAFQFGWEFRYGEANVTTRDKLVVPANRDVRLNLTSRDVIHSMFVPRWGVKQDAFPGRSSVILTHVEQPGEYTFYCTQFCGVGHSRMVGDAVAVSEPTYRSWLDDHRGERGVREVPSPSNGSAPGETPTPTPVPTPPGE